MEQNGKAGYYTGGRAAVRNNPEKFKLHFTSGTSMKALGEIYNTTEGGAKQLCVFAKKMGYITDEDSSVRKALAYKSRSITLSERRDVRQKEAIDKLGDRYDLYCLLYSKTSLCDVVRVSYNSFDTMFPDYEEIRKDPKYLEESIYAGLFDIKHIEDFKIYDSTVDDEVLEFPFSDDRRRGFKEALSMLSDEDRDAIMKYLGDKMTLDEMASAYGVSREQVRRRICKACNRLRHPARFRWIKYGYAEKLRRESESKPLSIGYARQSEEGRLDTFNLSVRSHNVLVRAHANTIEDVKLLIKTGHIHNVRNMGRKSVEEVMELVSKIDPEVKCPYNSRDEFIHSEAYREWQEFINKYKLGKVSYGYYYIANVDYLEEMLELNSKYK